MTFSFLDFLTGFRKISVSHEHALKAINLLKEYGFSHRRMKTDENGTLSFRMRFSESKEFLTLLPDAQAGRLHGIPSLYKRYKGRWGIPLGILLFALLVRLSTSVVWEIDVSGNEKLSEAEIIGMLDEFGFGVGTKFGGIDFDKLHNDFLLTTDKIAWIAINMEGTVAHVQVRENLGSKSKNNDSRGAANMIAAEDGQIVEVRVSAGRAAVQRGDVVRAGDLLISGLLTVREDGLRYEYGEGEILAQVQRDILVECPFTKTENVPTGRETVRKTVNFFAKDVKLFRNSGIEYATYDTIIMEKQLSLPGGLSLPVWIKTETIRETKAVTVRLTEEEAFAEASILLRAEIDALLKDAEILSIETTRFLEDGVYKIMAHAVCLTDIARTSEIELH